MWSFGINQIVTHAGGDAVTALFAQAIFVVLAIAVISGIALYRQRPEIDYSW